MQPRSRASTTAKPQSAYQRYLALRRVFRRRDQQLPDSTAVRDTLKGMLRRFVALYGVESLRQRRVEPVTLAIVRRMVALAETGQAQMPGGLASMANWDCFVVTSWEVVNLSAGTRKAESVRLSGDDHDNWSTRASVTYRINGRTVVDPSEADLRSMQEGDIVRLAPKGAKCDQYGTCYGTDPICLPFHNKHDYLNAARWLRDIDLRLPVRGEARQTFALFGRTSGEPYHASTFDSYVNSTLTGALGPARAKAYSPHSWRGWLASSLASSGASTAQIQALGRWMTPNSIRIYARMTTIDYTS